MSEFIPETQKPATDETPQKPQTKPSSVTKPAHIRAAEQLAKLDEQMKLVREFERKAHKKRQAIVGKAILAAAESDAALKRRMVEALRQHITSQTELAEIADLLL
jgi:hypothetical protein